MGKEKDELKKELVRKKEPEVEDVENSVCPHGRTGACIPGLMLGKQASTLPPEPYLQPRESLFFTEY
jgi:hypothetical protein